MKTRSAALFLLAATMPWVLPAVGAAAAPPVPPQAPWSGTVEERIEARRAIERVYWSHRIWPAENPSPKPPLEEVLSEEALRDKALDGLRKSEALAHRWGRTIRPADL